MPTIDLGDPLPNLGILVYNSTGTLADAATVVLTLTLPDGTAVTPAVTHPATGIYAATYITTLPGRYVGRWVATTITGGAVQEAYADAWDVDDTAAQSTIISLDDVKLHLGITQPGTDDRLRSTTLLASEMVEAYTGRIYRQRTIVEKHDGGNTMLKLRQLPVASVTSVLEFGNPVALFVLNAMAGTLFRGTPYGGYPWLPGVQNVTVTYVAGSASVPWRVRQGTLELVRHLWDSQRGGYSIPKQQGAGDDWDPRSGFSIPRRVAELLDFERGPGF